VLATVKQEGRAAGYDCVCCTCELRVHTVGRLSFTQKDNNKTNLSKIVRYEIEADRGGSG